MRTFSLVGHRCPSACDGIMSEYQVKGVRSKTLRCAPLKRSRCARSRLAARRAPCSLWERSARAGTSPRPPGPLRALPHSVPRPSALAGDRAARAARAAVRLSVQAETKGRAQPLLFFRQAPRRSLRRAT